MHDLDNPPVIIRTSNWKSFLLLVVCIGFVAIGLTMMRDQHDAISYFATAFFGLGVPVAIWRLLSPARLELSPNGLNWFNGRRTIYFSWHDFVEFRAYLVLPRSWTKHVGFVLVDQKRTAGNTFVRGLSGVDGSFGGSWTLKPQVLADLLNRAKAKWSGKSR